MKQALVRRQAVPVDAVPLAEERLQAPVQDAAVDAHRLTISIAAVVAEAHTSCYIRIMKLYGWSDEKNDQLRQERGITFEDIVFHVAHGGLLDTIEHPNQRRYAGQRIFVVKVEGYVCLVPFVEDDEVIFLKTIIPSRKMTKQYLRGDAE